MSKQSCVDVSVIVVNWNTRELLRACLASAFDESPSITMEMIVVDNASTDGSVEMVEGTFPRAVLIANAENRGFAAANNQGLAIAKGRYVLLLNSDTVVLDRAIEKTITFADQHLDTAVTGCRVLNPDLTLQNTCFMFPSLLNGFLYATYLYKLFPRSRFFGREQMTWWLRDDTREVDVVTGCYMLVSKQAIEDVGPLDDRFFMYFEETDWCYRFKAKGWKNRFTPDAQIIHIGGASAPKVGPRRACVVNDSFRHYMFKHWSPSRAYAGIGLAMLFYATRLAALVPLRVIGWPANGRNLSSAHWAGLKDLIFPGVTSSRR